MQRNAQLIAEYFGAVWNSGDGAAQERLIAPDYEGYWLIAGMPVRSGRAGHRAWLDTIRSGLPDARYAIEDLVIDDARAVARVTLRGTHDGPIGALAPTGREATVEQVFVFHIAGGQIVREWVSFDRDSFMRQLTAG